ncbi:MAG TPA: protein kinase, partial [Acidobacteriota bacterium]|nr:protein kinase [Acidobacteriota bacterium]
AAHEEGVVHRDLKPSNVLVDQNDRVYITDFGLARSLESADLTISGAVVGTPAYFSPEQARGQTAHAGSDIYVLGLILFELLTGELPYDRDNVDLFRTSGPFHLENKLKKFQPSVPQYLVAIIRKCLQPNPEFRYRTVHLLLDDLRAQQVKSPRLPDKRYRYAAALLVVAAIALAYFNYQKKSNVGPKTAPTQSVVNAASIAVLPFVNKTGKQDMEWVESAAGDLLITGLSNSGNLRVVTSDRIFQTLQDLKIGQEMNAQEIKKVAEILDTDFLIQGSFTQAGSIFRADVKMIDIKTQGDPVHLKVTGAKEEDVFPMIDQLALQIQQNLQMDRAAPASVSPVPLATLKAFEQGNDSFRKGDYAKSVEFYETSLRQTPQFARGYLRLSMAYDRLGEPEKAIQNLEQALKIGNIDARTND